ncbi:class I SAM-dependent methyltransferase [Paramicrobacterium chengjingii]|uniref:Class I SAM-dependent methyltransferase n=1 Tax=Paramicrobacterium chengjingii TaxID=2769067 RepID=A0ABX6YJF3_9MICO|nr:class I SAM-dependent methyltransferase [Microbacterium chengjingii]QPZ38951.1 class I SAM-dependent methyltransferase [Microbacterium chengjingii]
MGLKDGPLWNHNIHFHRVVLEAIPHSATSALDVGTGNGMLARDLRERLPDVTAIDVDAPILAAAQRTHAGINWVLADAMTHDFGRTFDVVASVAALHHFEDLESALGRLRELTAPGGSSPCGGTPSPGTSRRNFWAGHVSEVTPTLGRRACASRFDAIARLAA